MVGHSAQHEGKCNDKEHVCHQGSGTSQPLWLLHSRLADDWMPASCQGCQQPATYESSYRQTFTASRFPSSACEAS